MRRLLRDIASKRHIEQDVSTLEDFSVLIELQKKEDDNQHV